MKKILLLLLIYPFIVLSQTQIGQTVYGDYLIFSGGDIYGDFLGSSVSMNADGTRFVTGGTGYRNTIGCAKVFELINGTWTQIGQTIEGIRDSSYPNGHVTGGYAVGMSEDGNIIAVSATGPSAQDRGYVRMFEYENNVWNQIAYFGSDNGITLFGVSVNLNGDGSIIAIGAPENNPVGAQSGKTKVYWNHPGPWYQMGQSIFGDGLYDKNGMSVDLSSDGTILAVGSPHLPNVSPAPVEPNAGKVRIYEFQSGSWIETGSIFGVADEEYAFGYSLDLSANGNFLVIKSLNSTENSHTGEIQVYENISGTWTPSGNVITDDEIHFVGGGGSGSPIKISAQGDLLLVGIPYSDNNGFSTGECKILKNIEGTWTQIGINFLGIPGNVWGSFLGSSIDLTDDGTKIIIGSRNEKDLDGFTVGALRIYSIAELLATLEVVEDILGNTNGINVTAEQLNSIEGVSGAIDDVDYTTALQNGTFVDPNNPTPEEIQLIIDQVNIALSVNEYELLSFNLYPNPAKTQFIIQLNDASILEKVKIYNTLGQIVLNTKKHTVNTSRLTSGTYIVEIQTNQGKASKRLIIK